MLHTLIHLFDWWHATRPFWLDWWRQVPPPPHWYRVTPPPSFCTPGGVCTG